MGGRTGRWNTAGLAAMITQNYIDTVRLMLRVAPLVFNHPGYALKGGTAINLYIDQMRRLSVDLDVVYLDGTADRATALRDISQMLSAVSARALKQGLDVQRLRRSSDHEAVIVISDGSVRVKVEVNTVFRGSVYQPSLGDLCDTAARTFEVSVPLTLLDTSEVYAGKFLAALDRQHPRDLFDLWRFRQNSSIDDRLMDAFVLYLCGHSRPPHEILDGRDRDISSDYERGLLGMLEEPFPSLEELQTTRSWARMVVLESLNAAQRAFLIDFFGLRQVDDPFAEVELAELPALEWKRRNLRIFRNAKPEEFARQLDALNRILEQ